MGSQCHRTSETHVTGKEDLPRGLSPSCSGCPVRALCASLSPLEESLALDTAKITCIVHGPLCRLSTDTLRGLAASTAPTRRSHPKGLLRASGLRAKPIEYLRGRRRLGWYRGHGREREREWVRCSPHVAQQSSPRNWRGAADCNGTGRNGSTMCPKLPASRCLQKALPAVFIPRTCL